MKLFPFSKSFTPLKIEEPQKQNGDEKGKVKRKSHI
jgi:hypothetical protein